MQRRKERQARIKKNGLYIVNSGHGGQSFFQSGPSRHANRFYTADLEQESRTATINPTAKIRRWEGPVHKRPRPAQPAPDPNRMEVDAHLNLDDDDENIWSDGEGEVIEVDPAAEGEAIEEVQVLKDAGVAPLPPGIMFPPKTYIGQRRLHQLTSVVNATSLSTHLNYIIKAEFKKYDLSHDLTTQRLCEVLECLCNDFFNFATKLPDPDQDVDILHWLNATQHACQATTKHLAATPSEQKPELVKRLEGHLTHLVSQIRDQNYPRNGIDTLILQLDWFAVELGIRIGGPIANARGETSTSPAVEAVKLLVDHLLTLGVDDPVEAIRKLRETPETVVEAPIQLDQATTDDRGEPVNQTDNANQPPDPEDTPAQAEGPNIDVFAAEIWVRLIHTLKEIGTRQAPSSSKQSPLFWQFILASFRSSSAEIPGNTVFYEKCWKTTFNLCALSQFTIHGMTLSEPSLAACWDLVKFFFDGTFKQEDNDSADQDLYLYFLLSRCLLLHDQWRWKADNISPLVKEIVDKIFAPRKFANLGIEKPEFPRFLRRHKGSISKFEAKDTAYTLLLKFIILAAQDANNDDNKNKGLSVSVRKLLSLSEPASKLIYANGGHPDLAELSMLINRITAAVVATYLDPSTHESKVDKLRRTMSFSAADKQTRMVLIRGVMLWSCFLVRSELQFKLDHLAGWIGEMADTLAREWITKVDELKQRNLEMDKALKEIIFIAKLLLRAIRNVFIAQKIAQVYPEVQFFAKLKPLIAKASNGGTYDMKEPLQDLTDKLIDARFTVIPPERPSPPVPPAGPAEEPESQDYGDYFDDIDWSAAEVPEAIAGVAAPGQLIDYSENEAALAKALMTTGLVWYIYRAINNGAGGISPNNLLHWRDIHKWLMIYIGCQLIGVGPEEIEKEMMNRVFGNLEAPLKTLRLDREPVARKFDMVISTVCLQRYPKCYLIPAVQTRLLQNFAYSLVTIPRPDPIFEARFVAAFVSSDHLQHPLLSGVSCLPPPDPDTQIYEFKAEPFIHFRVPLIHAMLRNLDTLVAQKSAEHKPHILLITGMLSAMRNNYMSLTEQPHKADYATFCRDVVGGLKDCPKLSELKEFEFWTTWTL